MDKLKAAFSLESLSLLAHEWAPMLMKTKAFASNLPPLNANNYHLQWRCNFRNWKSNKNRQIDGLLSSLNFQSVKSNMWMVRFEVNCKRVYTCKCISCHSITILRMVWNVVLHKREFFSRALNIKTSTNCMIYEREWKIGGGRTHQKLLWFNFILFRPFAYMQQQHNPTNKHTQFT